MCNNTEHLIQKDGTEMVKEKTRNVKLSFGGLLAMTSIQHNSSKQQLKFNSDVRIYHHHQGE